MNDFITGLDEYEKKVKLEACFMKHLAPYIIRYNLHLLSEYLLNTEKNIVYHPMDEKYIHHVKESDCIVFFTESYYVVWKERSRTEIFYK